MSSDVAIHATSVCSLCGSIFPSVPVGVLHKCGNCPNGYCYPKDVAVPAHVSFNIAPAAASAVMSLSSLPTYVSAFQNKQIQEILKSTLAEANIAVDDDVVDKISHDIYTKLRNHSLI